jgi:hypothetical protein
METDPVRQPVIELIFRLALCGRTCGQIAKTLNDRGWMTKPARRSTGRVRSTSARCMNCSRTVVLLSGDLRLDKTRAFGRFLRRGRTDRKTTPLITIRGG